jgi:hypothetical protein
MARMQRPFFFLLVLALLSPRAFSQSPSPFLGSETYLQKLIDQAQSRSLFNHPEWRLLGHYKKPRKYWQEALSEVDGADFFLSPEGKTSPRAELLATLKGFFEPVSWYKEERLHPQCHFMARRGWLVEQLNIDPARLKLLDCPFQTAWKRKLDADKITLIFAASYMNNPASMFGHTFLKFHKRGQNNENDLLNYGLNFAAFTGSDGGMAFMYKGLAGDYKGGFSLTPYYLKLLEYSNVEGRDIWEYELDLTPHEVDRLVDHLLELEQTYFDYFFFSENCSYQLLGLLDWARPSLHLQDYFFYEVIPADTVSLIARQPHLVSKVKYRPALELSLEARLRMLSDEERLLARKFFDHQDAGLFLKSIEGRSLQSRAALIDAALAFGAVKEFEDHNLWKDPLFRLQSARASLGIVPERLDIQSQTGPPHEAHPPARVGIGGGSQREEGGFADLGFRFAYHELTESDQGLHAGAQIQFLYFQGRYEFEQKRLSLTRFRLFDLVSLAPWGLYQKPLSWKAELGYENTFGEDMAHLAGGAGVSFHLLADKSLVLGVFAEGEADYNKDLPREHFLGLGPGAVLRWKAGDHLRFLLQSRELWDAGRAAWENESQADAAYNFNSLHQLSLRFKSKWDQNLHDNEVRLIWERFFLL